MTDDERDLLALQCAMLAAGPCLIDRLAELTGLPEQRVATLLSALLRAGLAASESGGWRLKKPPQGAGSGRASVGGDGARGGNANGTAGLPTEQRSVVCKAR